MKRYLLTIITVTCISCSFDPCLYAQNKKNTITVTGPDGKVIKDATIWYNEGSRYIKTDDAGKFSIDPERAGEKLRIEAAGYNARLVAIDSISTIANAVVVLSKPLFDEGDQSLVNIPFGQLEKRRIVGAVSALKPDELLSYDLNQNVLGAINGRVPGVYNSRDIRGSVGINGNLGNAIVVVDGIPRSAPDNSDRLNMADDLNLLEIQEITVLRDATAKILYGAKADQGVILITTKRGTPYKRKMKVYAEAGMNDPVSYPNYLPAADYMTLYNEALANDGLAPKYAAADIQNTRNKTNPIRYPDESFYNSTFLRNTSQFFNVITEASGGNDKAQYFATLGLNRNGTLYKPQDGKNSGSDRINFRGNIDYKLNSWLSSSLDAVAVYNTNRYPNGFYGDSYSGDFFQFASTQLPNAFPTLIPVSEVHNDAITNSATLINGQYLLGGTNQYQNNLLGNLTKGGLQTTLQKSIQFNTGLKFDFNRFVKGLTANANFTYDFLNAFTLRQNNTYAIYEPSYVTGSSGQDSLVVTQYGADFKDNNQTVSGNYFQRRLGLYGTVNYKNTFNTVHRLDVTALAYMTSYSIGATAASSYANNKDQHFGLRANYMYNNKYVAEFSGAYVGSSYLPYKNRYAFSPSLGAAWIVSEEAFLRSNRWVNYLKVKASYGILHTDDWFTTYRLYNTTYGIGADFVYNNGNANRNSTVQYSVTGNPDLDFVKNKEFNVGFESSLFSNQIWLEANYFNIHTEGEPVIRSSAYTSYLGGFIPTENYDADKISGVEATLNYKGKTGKFNYNLGINMVYAVPRSVKKSEVQYAYDYQYRQGRVSDVRYGLVAEGLFKDAADIAGHAVQSYGTVQPGDIKYKDVNGDGIINDDDQVQIGNSHPRFQYGLNINLQYAGFEFFALGTAQTGSSVYYNNAYYWVYGDRKYSEVVLNRWTPATAETATYPRLTTTSGSNNFRNSTFWLYTDNYFTLNRAQLSYNLPARYFWKGVKVYLRGNNLFTISKTREQRELNVASSPQVRSYMFGIVGSF
ncbi:SusC/RagA family TonB-linked outer membrane protein (plasmid) [Pedobacter sp. BS3]|uniref:SusC/RagA family TonB-linked outer membrane protein n=1 Tax=Pedobacter sp. BS3 TaxID=2567937 RepID=UPI0011EC6507|nr:SusC/RagA family TonB-linked outer membrane protein [Pedobacter sp. BS3]TZF85514.1 SusC/RagA family TonB-linked outer membrane protein [Pedobacter sp. BS3]